MQNSQTLIGHMHSPYLGSTVTLTVRIGIPMRRKWHRDLSSLINVETFAQNFNLILAESSTDKSPLCFVNQTMNGFEHISAFQKLIQKGKYYILVLNSLQWVASNDQKYLPKRWKIRYYALKQLKATTMWFHGVQVKWQKSNSKETDLTMISPPLRRDHALSNLISLAVMANNKRPQEANCSSLLKASISLTRLRTKANQQRYYAIIIVIIIQIVLIHFLRKVTPHIQLNAFSSEGKCLHALNQNLNLWINKLNINSTSCKIHLNSNVYISDYRKSRNAFKSQQFQVVVKVITEF
uniref:Uncharacterized protein n=1 Tax=Glossina austeni TaxID=7395 RepID=A0A1A9UGV8_GLOAU